MLLNVYFSFVNFFCYRGLSQLRTMKLREKIVFPFPYGNMIIKYILYDDRKPASQESIIQFQNGVKGNNLAYFLVEQGLDS